MLGQQAFQNVTGWAYRDTEALFIFVPNKPIFWVFYGADVANIASWYMILVTNDPTPTATSSIMGLH
jgi:hypothetical protein